MFAQRCLAIAILTISASYESLAADSDAAVVLQERIEQSLELHAADSDFNLTGLTQKNWRKLLAGDAIIKVSDVDSADAERRRMGLYGYQLIEAPRTLVWLTVMGAAQQRDDRLTAVRLNTLPLGGYVRYQHIDVPWPFRDRHWVIEVNKATQVAERTGGQVWEHYWELHPQGQALLETARQEGQIPLADKALAKAVYLPANRGAWILFELDADTTLVATWLDSDLGGRFPDKLVQRFVRRQLRAGFKKIEQLTADIHLAYQSSPALHDGRGAAIDPFDVLQVADHWQQSRRLARND